MSLSNDHFMVEKGLFFPHDFTLRYDDIQDVRKGEVYLTLNRADLAGWNDQSYAGWSQAEDINAGRITDLRQPNRIQCPPQR